MGAHSESGRAGRDERVTSRFLPAASRFRFKDFLVLV